jgi:superfamily II DNA/RNA helicase
MNSTLKRWIAQSESWQASVDLHIPKEYQSVYHFLPRYDDFYISLMSHCMDILNIPSQSIIKEEALLIAKGMEIFSLKNKRDNFPYIDMQNNMLFAAGLYYLAGYTASSIILSSLYTDYNSDIESFISNILRKSLRQQNGFTQKLWNYFNTGDYKILKELSSEIININEESFDTDIDLYISSLLAKKLIEKIKDDNIWEDLLQIKNDIEYWKPYVLKSINRESAIINFFPSQRLALKCGILSNKTVSLQMPTSAGKTFLSEIVIYNQTKIDSTSKILYLTPYRALASELKKSLARQLKSLGISTTTIYGGNLPSIEDRNDINTSSVLISTPEKFIALQNILPNLDDDYSTIICDEGHLLDDTSRGLEYELLLSRLKANKNKKRFVFISAIIPNLEIINEWLGGNSDTIVKSDYRPTQLDFAFLNKPENVQYYNLDFNPSLVNRFILNRFLDLQELYLKKERKSYYVKTNKGITVASALKASRQGPVLIFAPHKRGNTGVEGIVDEIIRQLNLTSNSFLLENVSNEIIDDHVNYFSLIFGSDYLLIEAITNGFLYHHGDFPQFIREIIEELIDIAGFKIIVCTNTLTEGVNLPIKTIVIHSTKRYNPDVKGNYERLSIRELKNLVGRAGRAGKETKGLIIIPHADDFKIIHHVMSEISDERIHGNLYNRIIRPITEYLVKKRVVLDEKILEEFKKIFPDVIDSIDISLLELLNEEVGSDELMKIVMDLVSNTFSYFQSDENEKNTLTKIFVHRANTLLSYINTDDFKIIKGSGSSISEYEMINEIFDFENELWYSNTEVLSENWLQYIFDNGIFRFDIIRQSIDNFNERYNVQLEFELIKKIIVYWMKGAWYNELSAISGISVSFILELMNTIFQFEFQSLMTSIIRIAEIKNEGKIISQTILNWTKMFQYGLDSQLKLDLLELGLNDRVTILFLENYCISKGYNHQSKDDLKQYIKNIAPSIYRISTLPIPNIAFKNLINFIDNIDFLL